MSHTIQDSKVMNGPYSSDPIHRFQSVICEGKRSNGYPCHNWLGEIETTRPNISKHRCRDCNITYQHIVDDEGFVTYRISNEVTLSDGVVAKVLIDA